MSETIGNMTPSLKNWNCRTWKFRYPKRKSGNRKLNRIKTLKLKVKGILSERKKDLDNKKSELDTIVSESENDEAKLKADREKALKKIEERLSKSYTKIRTNAKNGLAVVMVKRGACGGCFNVVPPQRQADIREKLILRTLREESSQVSKMK